MKAGLTVEQMKLLLSKGFSGEEMIAFAEMGQAKSKGALRTARWRERRNGNVTNSVTSDGHSDASHPPIEDIIPPIPSNDGITRRPKTEKLAKPEGVTDGTWQDFLNHRNKKRAIVTAGVITTIATEAKKRRLDAGSRACRDGGAWLAGVQGRVRAEPASANASRERR